MIPPFVISLDLEIDVHGESIEERNSPNGLPPVIAQTSCVSPQSVRRVTTGEILRLSLRRSPGQPAKAGAAAEPTSDLAGRRRWITRVMVARS
jgi:hypothetical protein